MQLKKSLDESNQKQKDTEEERMKIELTVLEVRAVHTCIIKQ